METDQGWTLVTGATAGIGRALTELLLKNRSKVIAVGRRKERLAELTEWTRAAGIPAQNLVTQELDVTNAADVGAFIDTTVAGKRAVEVLVNNAGLALGVDKMQAAKVEDWDRMIDTNVKGLLYVTRALLPEMLQRGRGHIVNMGSVAGRWTYPQGGVYCATKFAVRALSEGLRMDLLGSPIRVSNIEPGMVETEFSVVRLGSRADAERVYAGMKPLTAHDVAETILWVLSRPPHVNVQELVLFPTQQAAIGMVSRNS